MGRAREKIMSLSKSFLFVSVLSTITVTAHYDIDDSLLYKIDFPGFSQESINQDDGPNQRTEDLESVIVTSTDKEKFECWIPKANLHNDFDEEKYAGKTVLELIESIFSQKSCSFRIESYWTYEVCHGKHIRQYHEEREGKQIKMLEFILGTFTEDMFNELVAQHKKDVANGITRHPPTKKIEGMAMPYYEVTMTEGTMCDLTKLPRRSRVLYVCYPKGRNEIYSFKEISTCEYEIVVLSSLLCSHPSYKPPESKENLISCQPMTADQSVKPVKLAQLEQESLKMRTEKMMEAHMTQGDLPGQVKIEIKPVQTDTELDVDTMDEIQDTIKDSQWKATNRQPFKPLMDPEVVKQFLKGDYCLNGGSGWWKYEFCYGKKVDQYHDEGQGRRTVINLGHFNMEQHVKWLDSHPAKKPKEGTMRKQVSVFYSDGDICDQTGQPRQIEVKLKCKPGQSASTVSLYLLEPKVCQYVLGVESPLVCDLLPLADSATGLFPTELVDHLGEQTEENTNPTVATPRQTTRKKTTYKSKEIVKNGETKSTVLEETVEELDEVKKISRRRALDGAVVSEETIYEKDGKVVQHSEITTESNGESDTSENKDEL